MFLRCLSSCDLHLTTEQEDTMHTYLGNLLKNPYEAPSKVIVL